MHVLTSKLTYNLFILCKRRHFCQNLVNTPSVDFIYNGVELQFLETYILLYIEHNMPVHGCFIHCSTFYVQNPMSDIQLNDVLWLLCMHVFPHKNSA